MSDPETLNAFKNFFKGGGKKSRKRRRRGKRKSRRRGGRSHCTIDNCERSRMQKKLLHNTVILGSYEEIIQTHEYHPSNYTADEPFSHDALMLSLGAFEQQPKPREMYKKEYDWFFIKLLINRMSDEELKLFLEVGTAIEPYRFKRRKNHLMHVLNGEKGHTKRVLYLKFKPLKGFKAPRPRRPSHHAPVWDPSVGGKKRRRTKRRRKRKRRTRRKRR